MLQEMVEYIESSARIIDGLQKEAAELKAAKENLEKKAAQEPVSLSLPFSVAKFLSDKRFIPHGDIAKVARELNENNFSVFAKVASEVSSLQRRPWGASQPVEKTAGEKSKMRESDRKFYERFGIPVQN